MRINTNVASLNSQRILGQTGSAVNRSIGRLSSGFRINRAADDAAGLGIANTLRADVRSLRQASRNAEQANSVLQVMEGATTQIGSILERMKELATQANSGTSGADNGDAKTQLNAEFQTLIGELDRIVGTTTFNGQTLLAGGFGTSVDAASTVLSTDNGVFSASLNGTAAGAYTLHDNNDGTFTLTDAGGTSQTVTQADGRGTMSFSTFGISLEVDDQFAATADADIGVLTVAAGGAGSFMVSSSGQYAGSDLVSVSAVDVDSTSLGVNGEDVLTGGNAQSALSAIDTAINTLNTAIGTIGAAQNRIGYAMQNVNTSIENVAAAESTIRDADMAAEMADFTKNQILQQAGVAMLAQANSAPQLVLRLLQ
jgi:flagellin